MRPSLVALALAAPYLLALISAQLCLPACLPAWCAGVENAFYEGPLRLRLPVAMKLDPDGAFSFELPLPSPEGALSVVR